MTVSPVLYIVARGGRSAGDLPGFIPRLTAEGWDVCHRHATALKFMNLERMSEQTGHVVRYDYKQPEEPDPLPRP